MTLVTYLRKSFSIREDDSRAPHFSPTLCQYNRLDRLVWEGLGFFLLIFLSVQSRTISRESFIFFFLMVYLSVGMRSRIKLFPPNPLFRLCFLYSNGKWMRNNFQKKKMCDLGEEAFQLFNISPIFSIRDFFPTPFLESTKCVH